MAHLSPRTKIRVHQINVFKKATGRSKRMVTAELMKKAEPPPPARRKTPPKAPAAATNENGYHAAPINRPLKRTRDEDHVFGRAALSEVPARRSVILKNGDVPAPAPAPEDSEPIKPLPSIAAPPESVRELHQRTSPAKEDLPRRSPLRLASVIERPTVSNGEESQSPCRGAPNGYPKTSPETDFAPTDQRSGQPLGVIEEYRVVDNSVTCANGSLPSPGRTQAQLEQCPPVASPQAIGFEDLLRRVGSPEAGGPAAVATCAPPLYLPAPEENGDSDHLKQRPGAPNSQRRVASPEYVAPPYYFRGLWNLGNTCYMNAVIQLLYNLDCFAADSMLPVKYNLPVSQDGIFLALRSVFHEMAQEGVNLVINPSCLQSACEKYMTDFCGSVQQDAQEYLLNVLDKIEEEITFSQKKVWQELQNGQNGTANSDCLCPTTRNFSCQVRNILSCEGCDNIVNVEQSCRHFSLPLPEDSRDPQAAVPDIEALLDIYFQVETLSRKCEKCGAETMKSETKIVQLPRVMVLHINRFEIDRHMLCSKVSVPVRFNYSLDLGKWCLDKVRVPISAEDLGRLEVSGDLPGLADCRENSHANGDKLSVTEVRDSAVELDERYSRRESGGAVSTNYELHGVVSHVGKLASCGHYTVDIYDRESRKYIRCDDALVREVLPEDVFCEEKAAEAYVLLYILNHNSPIVAGDVYPTILAD